MDWTGGTRRRFAGTKRNGSALQKQKAHFARARAATQREPMVDWLHRPLSGSLKSKRTTGSSSGRHRPDSCARVSHSRARRRGRATAHNDDPRPRSPKVHRTRAPQGNDDQPVNSIATRQGKADEELLLLANRRKLLARNDWLALDPARPLRLEFPVTADADRVGRRKKIKKASAQSAKPAQQRLLMPLFDERLNENDFVMGGALPPPHDEQIEVKVGNGAFDSQSHPSRRSMMSDRAPQSAASSNLSEESMLLGADGDTFDAEKVEIPVQEYNYVSQGGTAVDMKSFEHGSQPVSFRGDNIQSTRSAISRYSVDSDYDQQAACGHPESTAGIPAPDHSRTLPAEVLYEPYEYSICSTPAAGSLKGSLLLDPINTATPAENRIPHDSDAERTWKTLMGMANQVQSSTSNKALDSSSQHLTNSDILPRALGNLECQQDGVGLDDVAYYIPGRRHLDLEPNSFGPDQKSARERNHVAVPEESIALPEHTHSIQDNEALWREFIIGSQDSESEDELHLAWQRNRTANRKGRTSPHSLQLSGLGTSDNATQGEAVQMSPSALFAMQDVSADDADEF